MVMNKRIPVSIVILAMLVGTPGAMRSQEAAQAPSKVTVPVRVFSDGRFVDGLTLQDFEVTEDGVPQKLNALFQIDKNTIKRSEGESGAQPATARKFYLLFQLIDYHPKLSAALNYFFNEALLPGDTVQIQTPRRTYKLTDAAFAKKSRSVLAKEMDSIVRKDVTQGGLIYKSLIRDLRRFATGIAGENPMATTDESTGDESSTFGLELLLQSYRESLIKLESLRRIDQQRLLDFARDLKSQDGQKIVFFIYQREFRPEISTTMVNALVDNNQDKQNVLGDVQELFQVYHRNVSYDVGKLAQSFSDSTADFNFIFMEKTPESFGGIVMREQSEDIFKLFSQISTATGGIVDSTQNPDAGVRDVLKSAEACYLLSYTRTGTAKDGKFKTIEVKIKGKDYKTLVRRGYINN